MLFFSLIASERPGDLSFVFHNLFAAFFGTLPLTLITASFFAVRNRKIAAIILCAYGLIVAVCWIVAEGFFVDYVQVLELTGSLFFIPAVFWLVTERRGWPSLLPSLTRNRRVLAVVSVVCIASLTSVGAFLRTIQQIPFVGLGCKPVFTGPTDSAQAVFTAKAIYVSNWSIPRYYATAEKVLPENGGKLALMKVQHHYWGLPWWSRKYVILHGIFGPFPSKETYFVDAEREHGVLTRLFPEVGTSYCKLTAPLHESQLELRLLRDGPPQHGVRIVGTVVRRTAGSIWVDAEDIGAAGKTVVITGPGGDTVTTTDENGVFYVSGLPPGNYVVRRSPPSSKYPWRNKCGQDFVKEGSVFGCRVWDDDESSPSSK